MRLVNLSLSHLCSCGIDLPKITEVLTIFLVIRHHLVRWQSWHCISVDAIIHRVVGCFPLAVACRV